MHGLCVCMVASGYAWLPLCMHGWGGGKNSGLHQTGWKQGLWQCAADGDWYSAFDYNSATVWLTFSLNKFKILQNKRGTQISFLKGQGHLSLGTSIGKSQSLRQYFKGAPRPRPGATEAVAFVASLKFEACRLMLERSVPLCKHPSCC